VLEVLEVLASKVLAGKVLAGKVLAGEVWAGTICGAQKVAKIESEISLLNIFLF